jgi:hypothetical protein
VNIPWPVFGLAKDAIGQHAVVVSPHLGADGLPAEGDLAIWAETLLAWLGETGRRTTLLIPWLGEIPPPLRPLAVPGADAVEVVAAEDPRALSLAIDAALRRLGPELVHAPERGGTLLAALYARAAGLAHLATSFVIHARGPSLFREHERARFIAHAGQLLLDAQERRAAEFADELLVCCPAVAAWLEAEGWPATRPVAPLIWSAGRAMPPVADEPWELVLPGPLDSAEGLEFLIAALQRAGHAGVPWRVAVLGEPGEVTLDDPARLVASLGTAIGWSAPRAASPSAVLAHLLRPGRVLLLGARSAAPPELVASCIAMGVPVLGRDSPALAAWAARHPGAVEILPSGEREFARALAAWRRPARLVAAAGAAPSPSPDPSALAPSPSSPLLFEPSPPILALLPGDDPSRAERQALALAEYAGPTTVALGPPPADAGWVMHLGRVESPHPSLRSRFGRAARSGGRPVVTCLAADGTLPLGCAPELVFLDPGATLGEVVLIDAAACRAAGEAGLRVLAALGTEELPAAIAAAALPVLVLPERLHEPVAPRQVAPARRLALAQDLLPPSLLDSLRLLLQQQPAPLCPVTDPELKDLLRQMDGAGRQSGEYLSLLARAMERLDRRAAALDVWEALRLRAPGDAMAGLRVAALRGALNLDPQDRAGETP